MSHAEFVKHTLRDNLSHVLVPQVAVGLWSIYDNAKTASARNNQPELTLQTFQNLLTRVPSWTKDTLDKEVARIVKATKCDYLDDLLLGVFVSYIRAFASLQQVDSSSVNLEFDRPTSAEFVHQLYIVSARKCWTHAYLFKTLGVPSETQAKHRVEIEGVIRTALHEVIDSFIPWKEVSKAYFQPRVTAPPVSFGGKEVREYEKEEEEEGYESEEEDRPKLKMGEETTLDVAGEEDVVLKPEEEEEVDVLAELEAKLINATGEKPLTLSL